MATEIVNHSVFGQVEVSYEPDKYSADQVIANLEACPMAMQATRQDPVNGSWSYKVLAPKPLDERESLEAKEHPPMFNDVEKT